MTAVESNTTSLAHVLCSLSFHGRDQKLFSLLDKHNPFLDENCVDQQGYSPLHYAVTTDNDELVDGLCARAPRLLLSRDRSGDTPLHVATQLNNIGGMRALLSRGASPSIANYSGAAPLHIASVAGSVAALALLLDAGTFVGISDATGATCFHWLAVSSADDAGMEACVALLRERGAALDAVDDYGESALHWAAREANVRGVRALLDSGADPAIVSADGQTPASVAADARSGSLLGDLNELARAERCMELLSDALRRHTDAMAKRGKSAAASPPPMFTIVL